MKSYDVDHPDRRHVPELERTCWNQMPKAGWRDLKLYRYAGTNLCQWFGKKGVTSQERDWSVFEDQATEVFQVVDMDFPRTRDLPNLLRIAAAVIASPSGLTEEQRQELVNDLLFMGAQ